MRQQWGTIVPILAVVGLRNRLAGVVVAVLLILLASAAHAVLTWLRFSYAITDGRLVVEQGILRRSVTLVPVDRVRGVDVHASAIHRMLGIAVLRVDAAATGGKDDEAVLDAVGVPEAERLRDLLLRATAPVPVASVAAAGTPAGPAAVPAPPVPTEAAPARDDGEVLARFDLRWLRYAPLVGSYLIAPVAAIAAAQQVLNELHLPLLERLAHRADQVRIGPMLVALVTAGVVAIFVVGAVATAAVTNWNFTLRRRAGALVVERGLLSRRQVTLEQDRIRGYALDEPLLLRLAGAARLTALVTGLGGEGERGRRGQLLPLGPTSVARRVAAAAVLPTRAALRRHPPAARQRRLVRAIVPWLALSAGAALAGWWPLAGAGLALAAVGVPLGLDRYHSLGHGLDSRALIARSGSLRRRQAVVERRGVVAWQVRQSLFQRRSGLATVTVAVGAGHGRVHVIDVGAADAVALIAEVTPRHVSPLRTDTGAAPTLAP